MIDVWAQSLGHARGSEGRLNLSPFFNPLFMSYDHVNLDVLLENTGDGDPVITTPSSVDKPTITADVDFRCVDQAMKIEPPAQLLTGTVSGSQALVQLVDTLIPVSKIVRRPTSVKRSTFVDQVYQLVKKFRLLPRYPLVEMLRNGPVLRHSFEFRRDTPIPSTASDPSDVQVRIEADL